MGSLRKIFRKIKWGSIILTIFLYPVAVAGQPCKPDLYHQGQEG